MSNLRENAAGTSIRLESRSTRWAIVAFAVAALVAAALTFGQRIPLSGGDSSLGHLAGWLAALAAGVSFGASFLLEMRRGHAAWRSRLPLAKRILDLLAMTLGMAMLAYLVVMAVAALFQQGFRGLDVDAFAAAVLAGAIAAALSYTGALAGARVSSEGLAMLATLVLFMGTMASMVSSPDDSWWQLHFSQLGNTQGVTSNRFNLALMLAGLVITALANYVSHDLERGLAARSAESPRLVSTLAWLFAGIGICLFVVGLVPDAMNFAVHVGAASGMVVMFGAFSFVLLRRLPQIPREFILFTIVVIAGILVAIVLWVPIGYYNLTGMEFIVAGLLFAWLMVFVRAASAYATPPAAAA